MVDEVGIGNHSVGVHFRHGLKNAAVTAIEEGREAASGESAVFTGFGHIERQRLAQLAEDVLRNLGIVVKVGGLFGLGGDVAVRVVGGLQAEVAGLALFIGEAGGDIRQQAEIVEGISGLAGGDSVGGFHGLGEFAAGLGIVGCPDHCGHHRQQRVAGGFALGHEAGGVDGQRVAGKRGIRQLNPVRERISGGHAHAKLRSDALEGGKGNRTRAL